MYLKTKSINSSYIKVTVHLMGTVSFEQGPKNHIYVTGW